MKFEKDNSVCGCSVGAWKVKNDHGIHMEWTVTIIFLLQCLQHSVSEERGNSWNHRESNFKHFEQSIGLMRELWRANSISLKERDNGLHYPFPS